LKWSQKRLVRRKLNDPARFVLSVVSGHDRKAVQGENQVGDMFASVGGDPVPLLLAAQHDICRPSELMSTIVL